MHSRIFDSKKQHMPFINLNGGGLWAVAAQVRSHVWNASVLWHKLCK